MLNKLKHIILVLIAGVAMAIPAKASHVAGVDITYQCLGNDSFLVTVNVFRDCQGISWTATSINVNFSSTCGQNFNVTFPTTNPIVNNQAQGTNVSQLCPNSLSQSSCNGGNLPGMQLFTYQAIVVMSPRCNTWTIGYSPPCCRNTNLNLGAGSANAYVFSTMNSINDSCNNSTTLATNFPNPYACTNQLVCYDFGAQEQDGDSLVFSLINAYTTNATTPATYNAGYTGPLPIPGITINPQTGLLQFTPTTAGNYVVVVQVCEYDRQTGLLLGCIMRDMQFVVDVCANQAPSLCTSDTISAFTGNGAKINSNTVEVCYGQNFSFNIIVIDPDPNDSLTATSNVTQVLPGSTFSLQHYNGGDSLVITVSWTATIGANPFNTFNIQVSDQNCPITATNSATFNVKVVPSTYAGVDQYICKGQGSAQLNAIGGSTFTWSVINGTLNSLSCTNCANPVASPLTTTDYQVVSNLSSSCKNTDTVRIWVSENFDIAMHMDTVICFNDSSIPIFAVPSRPNKTYSFEWSPKAFVDYDTAQFPLATPIFSKDFTVKVTSDSGCIRRDTMTLGVSPPFPSQISITTNSSLACSGLSTQLDMSLGNSPSSCGINTGPCIGPELTSTLGTSNNTNGANGTGLAGWPAAYGNSNANARQQYLVRASELNALGMQAGKITGLYFDIASIGGSTNSYFGYTIKMGCTPDSVLVNWQGGLSTVFISKTVNLTGPGWHYHQFDNIYDWDGQSNIVIDICFANPGLPTQNVQTRRTATPFFSTIYFAANTTAACQSTFVSSAPISSRPNMRFDYCVAPDTNAYTYRWFPTTGLVDTLSLKPTATVSQTTTYYVLVEDTFNACYDTSEITLNIANVFAGNDTAICPTDTLQLNATATASCTGQGKYKWVDAITGGPAIGLSNDSIPNPFVTITSTQRYALSFSDNCNCSVFDTIEVALGQVGVPVITRKDPDCGLDNGEYSFNISGGFKPYRYTIDGGQTFQLEDSLFDSLAIGGYELFVIDSLGCPSDTVIDSLLNLGAPNLDSFKISNVNCFNVPDGTIDIFASGGVAPYWYSLDSSLTFQNTKLFTGLAEGDYNVVLMGVDSCRNFATPMNITQPTLFSYNFQVFDDTCHQLGDGYAIATGIGGTPPYNYNWSSSAQGDTIELNLTAGNYSLLISDSNNCTLDTNFTVNEPDEVRIDSILTTDITCFGYGNGKIEVYASGGDSIFRYSVDSGLIYQNNLLFDSLAPGGYDITIIDQSLCRVDSFASISEPPVVELSTNFDSIRICVSNCAEMTALASGGNGAPYTYAWSPNLGPGPSKTVCPDENMVYAVYAYDPRQCVSELKTIKVEFFDSLDVEIPADTFFCYGSQLSLDAVAKGGDGAGYYYEWTPYLGLNNPRIPNPVAFPDTTTTYSLNVWDDCGSPEISKDILIRVFPMPEIDFSLDTNQGCEPLRVDLINNSTLKYDCWVNYGTGELINTCAGAELEYKFAGNYDITMSVASKEGCENSKTIKDIITVHPRPEASFIMDPQPTTVLFTEIQFTDLSEGNIVAREWNFASLGFSDTTHPSFTFPDEDSASYPVRLKVITNQGCVDDTIAPVIIGQEYVMFVPTAFTPNGDGMNDVFLPSNTGVDAEDFTFMIFDRWGTKVFESKDKLRGWDGTNSETGEPAKGGVYVWKLIVGDYSLDKERHEYIGNLLLMR